MDGGNSANRPLGTAAPGMIHTGPFADSVAAAVAAASGQRTPSGTSSGVVVPPNNEHLPLPAHAPSIPVPPPSTPLSPPPIVHSRGLSPEDLTDTDAVNNMTANANTIRTANLQQPILSLTGVTFGGGSQRVLAPTGGSPPGSSPESVSTSISAGQGGGWRQMQRQHHDYQFGSRGGTMNTNPMAPPSKRRRTMMEQFGEMSLSQRRGMVGLDLATSASQDTSVGGASELEATAAAAAAAGVGRASSMRNLGSGPSSSRFVFPEAGTANANFNTSSRPSRPSPTWGLSGAAGPMPHAGFSTLASLSQSSPGMRRSVATSGSTPSEETIEDDDNGDNGAGIKEDPLDIAAPMATTASFPSKPSDPNVVRITSSDMESASDTASEMDEGYLDGLPPLSVAGGARPKDPVDAKIEELIRKERMKAMIQAKLEAEGKSKPAANGTNGIGSNAKEIPQRRMTRDDFDYQGTFTTAGSTRWRKADVMMDAAPTTTQAAPISIPAAIPPRRPASSAAGLAFSAATAAAADSMAMPPPASVVAAATSPNSNAKIAPGIQRGRSSERRSSRGSRSRSLPRQYMKMAPEPATKSRDVSMASASSAATSGGVSEDDMDL